MNIQHALLCGVLLQSVLALVYDSCKVVPASGLSIIKYYRKNCVHCQRIGPKIAQAIKSIEKVKEPVTGIMVDTEACSKYENNEGIESIPTVVVKRDGKELARIKGDKPYEEITKIIADATGLSEHIFLPEENTEPRQIMTLTKDDFLSSFTGPWVIYFEGEYSHAIESILLQTYKTFDREIKIAKYIGPDKEIVAGRYYIYDFPGILVMYDGILMRYNGEMTLAAFHEFCTKLVAPSFREITTEELNALTTPTFVVFYSDALQANRTFRRIAHDLKMNAQTYKMKVEAPENESLLRLAVFKNGSKFYYDKNINDEGAVREWLFHAHFPNISKLSMDNFYSIFHGLKPVVSIVLDGGNLKELAAFEEIAIEHNRGSSSSPYVFAFIDRKEYPKFTDTNFGVLHGKPLIVFFDPEKQVFYGKHLTKREPLEEYFARQLKMFETKTLPRYIREKPRSYKWMVIGGLAITGIGVAVKLAAVTKRKLSIE
ncbi:hypothetical protein NECID01_1417 [Nematocida sp. AWRm77]|nr:hypothetical protein NECID01_1417 [Nematocida sp. AWRm77]